MRIEGKSTCYVDLVIFCIVISVKNGVRAREMSTMSNIEMFFIVKLSDKGDY
jgi:hypothetical protein